MNTDTFDSSVLQNRLLKFMCFQVRDKKKQDFYFAIGTDEKRVIWEGAMCDLHFKEPNWVVSSMTVIRNIL